MRTNVQMQRTAGAGRDWARRLLAALSLAGALVIAPSSGMAQPQPNAADLVKVDLIAEPAAIRAGEPFWVGIRLRMQEHWHTYWRNPGDSGEPTSVTWRLPQGFTAGELAWPAPAPIRVGPVASYGYEGEAVLLTQITPPRELRPGAASEIAAQVSYLVCEKICIPGEANVTLTLPAAPAGDNAMTNAATRDAFAQARARLPQPSPWTSAFKADAKTVTLTLAAGAMQNAAIREAAFFPHDNTLIVNAAPQTLARDASGLRLTLERSQTAAHMPRQIDGVLQVDEDIGGQTVRHAFALSAVTAAGAASGDSAATLLQAVLLALLGGLILNLMPCVFPVLSLKILHLTQHAGETRARVRLHGLAYTLGILASFALLAGVLFAVRAGGAEIGWGFQLQSPAVVAALAFVLFAMGLSLSGVLQFGASMTRVGGMLMHAPGLSGSFFAGVLATVVATPCTAPFMGAAIGFALTQPFALALAVFLALGFGLALPFLALSFAPVLLRRLPRPGAWMETLKQALAFPLYATVVWLIWVLEPAGWAGRPARRALGAGADRVRGLGPVSGARATRRARTHRPGFRGRGACRPCAAACGDRFRPPGGIERAGDAGPKRRRGFHAGEARRVVDAGPPGLRQHDGGLVHHLHGQRAHRAVDAERARCLRAEGHRLPQGRLDQPQPGNHPAPGKIRQERCSSLCAV